MKKLALTIIIATSSAVFFLAQCTDNKTTDANNPKDTVLVGSKSNGGFENQVKWGEHMVTIMGCGDCHTPKKMTAMGPVDDSSLLLSGHPSKMPPPDVDRKEVERKGLGVTNDLTAWVGPWGISYSANITSDETGIGNWSEDQFILALRQGKWKGMAANRELLPPMPWQSFRHMNDDEMKAIFAFLKSTKPIQNVEPPVQQPVSPPPPQH